MGTPYSYDLDSSSFMRLRAPRSRGSSSTSSSISGQPSHMPNSYISIPKSSVPPSPTASTYTGHSSAASGLDQPEAYPWFDSTTSFPRHPSIPDATFGSLALPELLPMAHSESSGMSMQRQHSIASYTLMQAPAPVEDFSGSERIDTQVIPEVQLHPIVQHHSVHVPAAGEDYISSKKTGSVPEEEQAIAIPENKQGMAKQWSLLNSVGKEIFGLGFVCLEKFMVECRKPFGNPGDDLVFDAALERAVTKVIGTGRFINEAQYRKTKLKPIYDSIEPIYDDGANILETRILEFFPELTVPPGIEPNTDEWRNALRASAEELVARPGNYLHLVCAIHCFDSLIQLTITRSHRLERFSSTNTLAS